MDDSINVKQKKTDSKEYTLYDSIYKTSKTDKTNSSMTLEIRVVVTLAGVEGELVSWKTNDVRGLIRCR